MRMNLAHLDLRTLLALYGGGAGAWAPVMLMFTLVGSGWTALALLPATLFPRTRRFAVTLALAIVAQASLVCGLKAAVGRVRPWIALGLPAPIGAPHDGSFPSGHAAGSFCVVAFLAVTLPAAWPGSPARARGVVVTALVVAIFVACSRVYLGAHFPGDVVCGGLVGAAVGAMAGSAHLRATSTRPSDGAVERAPERG
jgi:undecaprenyl-diphosphatase